MDLFRRNQKYIFWVVAAIIIPSFVLVWGVNRAGPGGHGEDFNVGVVNGRNVNSTESRTFQRRLLQGALGGLPLHFANVPETGTRAEELSSILYTMAFIQDAQKADLTASNLQVGTYIDNGHPVLAPRIRKDGPGSREREVEAYLRETQLTRADFLQGVRDWQTVGNYIDIDNRLTTVTDETAFTFYALNRAEVVVRRVLFMENDDLRQRAKAEIMAKPPEDLEREAMNHAAGHADEQRYREPSKWRFGWILVPFVPASSVQVTDADIEREYQAGGAARHGNRPLAEIRDLIRADLTRQEVERQTRRNSSVDVEPQLRTQKDMAPDDLVKLAQLAKYGVTVGDTGPEALSPAEVVKALPEGTSLEFATGLEALDSYPPEARDAILAGLRDGYNLAGSSYRSDKGLYRIHLLDYQPSTPARLDGPDGKMVPELYETALSDLVGERAAEMARQDAADMEAKVLALMAAKQQGGELPDPDFAAQFEALPTSVIPYMQLADSDYGIGTLPIGDVLPPRAFADPRTGERGYELIAVVGRRVPGRASFNSEPDEVRALYRQIALANYWGDFGITEGPAAFIRPSPSLMGGLLDRAYKGQIRVNPDLFRETPQG